MCITQQKLISLLNKDIELEYSAAIQYINHSSVMSGAAYGDIIKEIKFMQMKRFSMLCPLLIK